MIPNHRITGQSPGGSGPPARGGVISRRDIIAKLGRLEDRPEWAEAIYLLVHHTNVSYTIETPKPFPIEARVKAHIAAVETLMNSLTEKINPLHHSSG